MSRKVAKIPKTANRDRAIEIYGGRCEGCGSAEQLEFDHIYYDGSFHRSIESTAKWLAVIAKLGKRDPLFAIRLLCHDCHSARTYRDIPADSGRPDVDWGPDYVIDLDDESTWDLASAKARALQRRKEILAGRG